MKGKFVTFEGGEGTGKSTQAAMLALKLKSLGMGVKLTREPGGSPGAEIVRHVLLSGAAKLLGPDAEAILFAAARNDHVRCTILPALDAGQWVISDRFIDSTRVYQGALGEVDVRLIKALERVSVAGLQKNPNLVRFFCGVSPNQCFEPGRHAIGGLAQEKGIGAHCNEHAAEFEIALHQPFIAHQDSGGFARGSDMPD